MKCHAAVLFLLGATIASGASVTPVQKVIQLMENMKEKGTTEMQAEQVQYAKYKQFCETTLVEKAASIKEAGEKMELLAAAIEKNGQDAEQLGNEIAGHKKDLETASAEQDQATKVREDERKAFSVTLKDLSESIDALGRALKTLREQDYDRKQTSLLQVKSLTQLKLIPDKTKKSLNSFLQMSQAPEAEGYEFQSGGVIQMLEDLEEKFTKERVELEKDEASKKHAYSMLVQGLEAQQAQSKKDMGEKTQFKAKKLQAKADAQGDLEETTSAQAADQKYSDDLAATCEKKKSDFGDRQKLRKEELEAIQKAVDIISSGAVAGSAEKHLPSLVQMKSSSVLAQLRASSALPTQQVARFLQQQAKQINSHVLSALAVRLGEQEPDDDAMEKVRQMIEGLITKLNEQAQEEATKKGYCDKELKQNELTRTEKADAVDSLKADLDEVKSVIAGLEDDISTASKEISELNAAVKEATKIRQVEKANNTATIKDAKEAQAAVASAVTVLNEFYAKAAQATAFVQTSHKQPEIFDSAYTGMGSAKGGVVGMLEVIESDFARLQAETEAAEQAAAKEFEDFMEDSKIDKAKKTKDVEHKTAKKSEKAQLQSSVDTDLTATVKELDAAMAYFEKLKPDCLDAGVAYEQRKAQREQEIKDLTEALNMLESLR